MEGFRWCQEDRTPFPPKPSRHLRQEWKCLSSVPGDGFLDQHLSSSHFSLLCTFVRELPALARRGFRSERFDNFRVISITNSMFHSFRVPEMSVIHFFSSPGSQCLPNCRQSFQFCPGIRSMKTAHMHGQHVTPTEGSDEWKYSYYYFLR